MTAAKLTFAAGLYDRMVPLATGKVKCPGLDVEFLDFDNPRDIFDRMVGNREFDGSELSISEYITRFAAGDKSFVAIPIFPSRSFRHNTIYVNTQKIKDPSNLNGARIGVPLYTMTAAVWVRGFLQHEFGVDVDSIQWLEGDVEKPGRYGNPSSLPPLRPLNINANVSGRSLGQLLADGDLDAIISLDVPTAVRQNDHLKRLFPNFKEVEMSYYQKTGIFPIMHTVVLRREYYEKHPFALVSLYSGLSESKEIARKGLFYTGCLRNMLPWLLEDLEEMAPIFGADCWPYGLDANRKTLDAVILYLYEQGLIERRMSVDELYADFLEAQAGTRV